MGTIISMGIGFVIGVVATMVFIVCREDNSNEK